MKPRSWPAAQAAAVAAQVEGVEVEAEVVEGVGEVGLEEVVVPAVHVEHRGPVAPSAPGRLADQGGDQLDVLRLAGRRLRRRAAPGRWSRSRQEVRVPDRSHHPDWHAVAATTSAHRDYLMRRQLTGYL